MPRIPTRLRPIVVVVAAVYVAAVIAETFLPFRLGRSDLPWEVWVQPVPLATVVDDPSGILLNLVLFVPLGVLLPLVGRIRSWRGVLLAGFLASLGIETAQLLLDLTISRGRVADVDDLIGNTVGAMAGYGMLVLGSTLVRRVIAARATTIRSTPG